LKKVKCVVSGKRKSVDVKQEHRLFNKMMVSTGKHFDVDGSVIKFTIVQDPETKKLHGKWERIRADEMPIS